MWHLIHRLNGITGTQPLKKQRLRDETHLAERTPLMMARKDKALLEERDPRVLDVLIVGFAVKVVEEEESQMHGSFIGEGGGPLPLRQGR